MPVLSGPGQLKTNEAICSFLFNKYIHSGLGAVSAIHDAVILASRLYHLPSTPRDPTLKVFEACTKADDVKAVFQAYKDERYPLAVQSYATSKQLSKTLSNVCCCERDNNSRFSNEKHFGHC